MTTTCPASAPSLSGSRSTLSPATYRCWGSAWAASRSPGSSVPGWGGTATEGGGDFLDSPTVFYQWHTETFEIPDNAVHLAHNDNFPGQAFRYDGSTYAIEFHPEMTREMIDKWCTSEGGSPKLELPGAQPREAHLKGYDRFAMETDRWLEWFLHERFLVPDSN
jgi:hypothetical protein